MAAISYYAVAHNLMLERRDLGGTQQTQEDEEKKIMIKQPSEEGSVLFFFLFLLGHLKKERKTGLFFFCSRLVTSTGPSHLTMKARSDNGNLLREKPGIYNCTQKTLYTILYTIYIYYKI